MTLLRSLSLAVLPLLLTTAATHEYGIDISWPNHYPQVSTNYPWLPHNVDPESNPVPEEYIDMPIQPLGDQQSRYEQFIHRCYAFNEQRRGKGSRCIDAEQSRLESNLRQPQSMRNYTRLGYKKLRAPEEMFRLLRNFWDQNKESRILEKRGLGDVVLNMWESTPYMVNFEDPELTGYGPELKQSIWNGVRDTIQEWTGHALVECSLYGIRVYTANAMLTGHVDDNPLVSSAIINVDQDVDEPWPLEVIGHDGIARNVTMLPGDMVLYESHSIIHSRPFPLKGRFMANVFVHFEPLGPIQTGEVDVQLDGDLPPYILPGSPHEQYWRDQNPNGHMIWNMPARELFDDKGATKVHHFAEIGDLHGMRDYFNSVSGENHIHIIHHRDALGWTPLANAVRMGHYLVTLDLLDRGSDMNLPFRKEGGRKAEEEGSLLWLAKTLRGDYDPIVALLESRGARYVPPSVVVVEEGETYTDEEEEQQQQDEVQQEEYSSSFAASFANN